jgi:hypothetical protein
MSNNFKNIKYFLYKDIIFLPGYGSPFMWKLMKKIAKIAYSLKNDRSTPSNFSINIIGIIKDL